MEERLSDELAFLLSDQESTDFSYDAFDNETGFVVRQLTSEIKTLTHRSAQDIFDIGQKLIEVKEKLGHGSFLIWLKAEFGWSDSTARKFMRVARKFKTVNLTDLKIASSALYLLASNSTTREARLEALERAKQGEAINQSNAKSIINRCKKMEKPKSQPEVTVDVSAETVSEEGNAVTEQRLESSERENIDYEQLKQRAKQLGLLPPRAKLIHLYPMPVETVKICTKFVDAVENMDIPLLETMEDEGLKVVINKSTLLAKRAKMLLNQKRQAGKNN